MDRKKGIRSFASSSVRRLLTGTVTLSAAWLIVVAATSISQLASPPGSGARNSEASPSAVGPQATRAPAGGESGWGGEVLATVRDQALALAPLPVANACGIGASSCFKCHNGSRAAAPKSDKAAAPWHPDHKTVNDSCVGCHGGNARIIKKEIAHANLVKDPRARAENCTNCHKSGNAPSLLKPYQVAQGGK